MLAQTLDDVVSPYLKYPKVIQMALLRLECHPTFRTLPPSTIPVLKAFVTRACKYNGCAPVHAKLGNVADEAGVSYKTVQRVLKACLLLGWVTPIGEGRSEYGQFITRWYRFSQAFCELVLLPIKPEKATQEPELPTQETEMSDGAIYKDLSLKKEYQEISIKNRGENPIKLPPAVEKMPEETGIKPTGICKLLGIAARAGYQLEHVYLIAKPYLQRAGATRSRAFSYMHKMLANPKKIDYAGKAAQILRAENPQGAKLAQVARSCRFKKYQHPVKGLSIRIYDGTADVTDFAGNTTTYVGRQMEGIYKGIAAGHLVEVIE